MTSREDAERSLIEWATVTNDRDRRIVAAHNAGISKNRIYTLTGVARTTIDRILKEPAVSIATTYGTWDNYTTDPYCETLEDTVTMALGADAPGRLINAVNSDYRQAINDALPEGIHLVGSTFTGTSGSEGIDLKAIVDSVHLGDIINRHLYEEGAK